MEWLLQNRRASLLILSTFVLLLFLKIYFYYTFHYISDVFGFLEASASWIRGMPILTDNLWGPTAKYHNYYLILLIGPLAHLIGGSALFIFSFLFFAGAGVLVAEHLKRQGSRESLLYFICLYLGPVTWWLWDEPVVGWHSDVLFFPLGLCYLVALRSGSWIGTITSFVFLFFNREEGPVIAFAIHLLHECSGHGKVRGRALWKTVVRLALIYVPFFLLGLGLIKYNLGGWNVPGKVQTSWGYLRQLPQNAELRSGLLESLRTWSFIVLSVFPFFIFRLKGWYQVGVTICAVFPLLVIAVIGGINYGNQVTYGVLFPPRFAVTYGILVASTVAFSKGTLTLSDEFRKSSVWLAVVVLIAQALLLDRLQLLGNYREIFTRGLVRQTDVLSRGEIDAIRCLARVVPREATVVSTPHFFLYFERHSRAYGYCPEAGFGPYSMIVCDRGNRFRDYDCVTLQDKMAKAGWAIATVDRISISFDKEHEARVSRCGIRP